MRRNISTGNINILFKVKGCSGRCEFFLRVPLRCEVHDGLPHKGKINKVNKREATRVNEMPIENSFKFE